MMYTTGHSDFYFTRMSKITCPVVFSSTSRKMTELRQGTKIYLIFPLLSDLFTVSYKGFFSYRTWHTTSCNNCHYKLVL